MRRTERSVTCCFTGYREEKLPWRADEHDPRCVKLKTAIADTLNAVYDAGYRRFICGMATGADMYFGEAVIALREEHPDITLEGAVPYQGQEMRWKGPLRKRYFHLSESCDILTVLHTAYTRGCMMDRNRYMADQASLLIAVYDGRPGGTRNTFEYAKNAGLAIIQLPVLFDKD